MTQGIYGFVTGRRPAIIAFRGQLDGIEMKIIARKVDDIIKDDRRPVDVASGAESPLHLPGPAIDGIEVGVVTAEIDGSVGYSWGRHH